MLTSACFATNRDARYARLRRMSRWLLGLGLACFLAGMVLAFTTAGALLVYAGLALLVLGLIATAPSRRTLRTALLIAGIAVAALWLIAGIGWLINSR